MSSSPLGGLSTSAAILNHDKSLELELLREHVGGLLQTIDGLEDTLLAQTEHVQMQAIECADIAQSDEAWWSHVYYQENYRLHAQVANLDEERLYLKGTLCDPRSMQAAADHEDQSKQEVNNLKDKLKKAKEQAEEGQNEVEWWQVKHYQEQYCMHQEVCDLEDEIIALKDENIQAGCHS
ncbi:hypothetical protein EDD85DRAFT_956408 [Armillaria nabsnona]|nr:hypothetical protein EDD85DRAFT_956408 [Armillaria nabsnona]